MKVVEIKKTGKIVERDMQKIEFVKEFNLNIRDLRPVFSDLQVATILPRHEVIVINLGFAKAVLSQDRAFFFRHNNKETLANFIKELKSIDYTQIKQDFHLFILEKIFDAKTIQLQHKIKKLRNNSNAILENVQEKFDDNNLKQLLDLKKRVSRMEVRLNEIYQAIKEILEVEDNFEGLVTFGQEDIENKDRLEAESILENFIEQIEDDIRAIFRLKEEIEDVEEYVDLKLSSQRTGIVMFDLIATIVTLALAFLAVIVGLFGVNIRNGFENSQTAFIILSASLIIMFIGLVTVIIIYLKRRGIIQ